MFVAYLLPGAFFLAGILAGRLLQRFAYQRLYRMVGSRPLALCRLCAARVGTGARRAWLRTDACRSCRRSCRLRQLAVQLLAGLLFALCAVQAASVGRLLALCLFSSAVLVQAVTDCERRLLLDEVTLAILALGLLYASCEGSILSALTGVLLALAVMLCIYAASRGGLGLGDVKLACALGAWLGWEDTVLCLLLAFITGGLAGIALLATGSAGRKTKIAFAPFLCASGWAALLYGERLLRCYWQLFS